MRRVWLNRDAVYQGRLVLVNAAHPLRRQPRPEELEPVDQKGDVRLERRAAERLNALLAAVGPGIVPVSGWRSFEEQQDIYRSALREHGERFTRSFVALPGRSEHQSGLAIDLGEAREQVDFLCPEFPDRGACREFCRRMADFGWIRRYPAGREAVTGIAAEPWHFRYVGRPHAQVMERLGATLEEYVDLLREYPQHGPHLREAGWEVWYVPAGEGGCMVELPDGVSCRLSGNNVDGVVLCREVGA